MGSEAPISPSGVRWVWAFQEWANDQMLSSLEILARAEDALFVPGSVWPGSEQEGGGSIYHVPAHLIASEAHWLRRWQGDPRSTLAEAYEFEGVTGLAAEGRATAAARRTWMAGLTSDDLVEACDFYRSDGSKDAIPLWQAMFHVANHSTHHRAELYVPISALRLVAALDSAAGEAGVDETEALRAAASPPSVDMVDWIRAGCPGVAGA